MCFPKVTTSLADGLCCVLQCFHWSWLCLAPRNPWPLPKEATSAAPLLHMPWHLLPTQWWTSMTLQKTAVASRISFASRCYKGARGQEHQSKACQTGPVHLPHQEKEPGGTRTAPALTSGTFLGWGQGKACLWAHGLAWLGRAWWWGDGPAGVSLGQGLMAPESDVGSWVQEIPVDGQVRNIWEGSKVFRDRWRTAKKIKEKKFTC